MIRAARIVLGTAQLGLAYGLANRKGQPDDESARKILEVATLGGIELLDTAIAYGESEARLGRLGVRQFGIMTKLPTLPEGCVDPEGWVQSQIEGSLKRLNVERLWAVSFHRPEQLLSEAGARLYGALAKLQKQELVARIGISVYEPAELDGLCERYRFDVVQAPVNVFDRRLSESPWLQTLVASGCEVHARSVFLQGLLLMRPAERPPQFERWKPLFQTWDKWLLQSGCDALRACVGTVMSIPGITRIVIGVEDPNQLRQIMSVAANPLLSAPDALRCPDPDLLNPSRWSLS